MDNIKNTSQSGGYRLIASYDEFITEAEQQEVKLKVDNTGHKKYYTFFKNNQHLFKPHNNGAISRDSEGKPQGIVHAKQNKKLEKAGKNLDWPYGYCYPVAQFVFYSLGGYDSDWDLKLIKKLKYDFKGTKGHTTHWFVQHKTNGKIIDLTDEQFKDIPKFDLMDHYPNARRANLGFPYYNTKNGKKEFGHTVPSMQCLKPYDAWRSEKGQIKGLEKYWKAANYASERREAEKTNEAYSPDELAIIPIQERHCF